MLSIACLGATAKSVHGLSAMPLASLMSRTPTDSATTLPDSRAQPALVAASVARLVKIRDEINGIRSLAPILLSWYLRPAALPRESD
jgi:hypothetical protein